MGCFYAARLEGSTSRLLSSTTKEPIGFEFTYEALVVDLFFLFKRLSVNTSNITISLLPAGQHSFLQNVIFANIDRVVGIHLDNF